MINTIKEILYEIFEEAVYFIKFEYSWWLYAVVFFFIIMYFSVKKEYRISEIQKRNAKNTPEETSEEKDADASVNSDAV